MRHVTTAPTASPVDYGHRALRTTKRDLVNHLHPSQRGLRLVNNDHRRPQDDEPGEHEGIRYDASHDYALAAINSEPPGRLTKVVGGLVLLAIAALAVSGAVRGIVWMWS